MAAGCKAAIDCLDTRVPVRASYVSLYKWPESDAEFVRSVAMARRQVRPESPGTACYNGSASTRRGGADPYYAPPGYCSPRVVDSYSCRQMYLRSYTFSKRKETVPERTMACLGRIRERAAVFPLFPQRGGGGGSDAGSIGSASGIASAGGHCAREDGRRGGKGSRRRRNKKKGCAMVTRLQEASCSAFRTIFHHLLACTTSVEVADGGERPSR